jgi:ion channel
VLTIQAAVRVVYGIDITIRSALARHHVHYLLTHPLGIASVIFPPVRVIFSLRLVRSVFRRGNLRRFLLAASVMVLNGALIVYLFERHAPRSNIHTLGESLWWSAVTVTTVGYGDRSRDSSRSHLPTHGSAGQRLSWSAGSVAGAWRRWCSPCLLWAELGSHPAGHAVAVITITVLLSVVMHGVTAEPLATWHERLRARPADGRAGAHMPEMPERRLICRTISGARSVGGADAGGRAGSGDERA